MNHKGFTLIELLIVVTIFSLVMAGLYPIFVQITSFNQENYIRTILLDNLRVGMDRLESDLRNACYLYNPIKINFINSTIEDDLSYNSIIFSHRDNQNPTQIEIVRYRLATSSYTMKIFPYCKQLIREIWNGSSWVGGNPITEPTIKDIIFKKQGQLIKVCIISYVQLRLKGEPQEYIYLGNIALRNNLTIEGCVP